jgi:hypothetical protein
MSSNSWWQTIFTQQAAGPTLTAAAAASMLVASSPAAGQNRCIIPAGTLKVGDRLRFTAGGIISCAVTTPGTATFDVRFGSTVLFSSGAMPLNIVAQTNANWKLQIDLTVRSIGATTAATVWGDGIWLSPASINSAAPGTGPGPGGQLLPYGSAQAISTGFDSTIANIFDSYFTQTVGTGSLTCEQAELTYCT